MAQKPAVIPPSRGESLLGAQSCVFHSKALSQAELGAGWRAALPGSWVGKETQGHLSACLQGREEPGKRRPENTAPGLFSFSFIFISWRLITLHTRSLFTKKTSLWTLVSG